MKGHLRSSKVIDFVTNRKRMYDFLLTNNSNYGSISSRFKDMATHMLKIADFLHPRPIWRHRCGVTVWQCRRAVVGIKLESPGYIFVADGMGLASFGSPLLSLKKSDTVKNDTKLP